MQPAGYSTRSLPEKLGLQPGQAALVINPPDQYKELVAPHPVTAYPLASLPSQALWLHFFTTRQSELEQAFPLLKAALAFSGTLWISWPKQAAHLPTDINENTVRDTGLQAGLVDVKVAAIDTTWSGLKFVYRPRDRA